MRYQEAYLGSKAEFGEFIKKAVPDLFAGRLAIEGTAVAIPEDAELDYKVKFDDNAEGGAVSFKVSWEKEVPEELTLDD